MQKQMYVDEFDSWDDVAKSFGGECPTVEPTFVFAEYDIPGYEGYATVVVSDDGKAFSAVYGSHCSCYGLEGQWEPTEHSAAEITKMYAESKPAIVEWLNAIC